MGAVTPTATRRRRDELVEALGRADDASDVFAETSNRLRRLVPFDAAVWVTADPATGLPTAPTRIDALHDVTAEQCSDNWRREYLVSDVNLFRDVARSPTPAAGLRTVAGDPARSPRYRKLLQPLGFDDELRAVFRAGDSAWGLVSLMRGDGRAPFTSQETEMVASLAAPIGEALRVRARPTEALGGLVRHDQPGLMLFDANTELVSTNEQAKAWLAELPEDRGLPTDLGIEVPMWVLATVFRAAAGCPGHGDGTARARVRTRRGPWLVCHASCVRDAGGSPQNTVAVIEAAKAAEIAPIIVQAYDLSDREQQITRLIARGASTTEIASELFLSSHTVRDHVKAIFGKVEVASRGELVAKLFAEYYEPVHLQGPVVHTSD